MSAELIAFPGTTPPATPAEAVAPAELGYIEPVCPPEYFVRDLARVHVFGSATRLIFTAPELANDGEGEQNVGVAKLMVPTDALRAIYDKIGAALGVAATAGAG